MPAAITHYLLGLRVLKELKKQGFSGLDGLADDAFLWGAQGPDFLFTHRYLPWQSGESLSVYGDRLHHERPEKLLELLRNAAGNAGREGNSYAYGFLCHYAADSIVHPFVNYGAQALLEQDPSQSEGVFHNQIESALDVIVLRYEQGALPVEFNLKRTVPKNPTVRSMIAGLYSDLLYWLYGLENAQAALFQATSDCRTAFRLLNDRTSLKKNLVERFERKKGKRTFSCHIRGISEGDEYDYANTLLQEWQWPIQTGLPSRKSFFDLYEEAVSKAVDFITQFSGCRDFLKMTHGITFEGIPYHNNQEEE